MKKQLLPLLTLSLLLATSCVVGAYHDRYGTQVAVAPEFWGTVTYVDPAYNRIDLDYYDGGRHYTRQVYYDPRRTSWDGVRYNELRPGDQVWVNGREHRGRWDADHIRRH